MRASATSSPTRTDPLSKKPKKDKAGAPGAPAPEAASAATRGPLRLRRLLAQIGGARLCYGEPVVAHGRTVIPVARVRAAGGGGFGGDGQTGGDGGGGGGWLDAAPIGFIDVGADGARFQAIDDPEATAKAIRAAAAAATTLLGALAVRRSVGRRTAGLAPSARRLLGAPRRLLPAPRRLLRR